MASAGGGIDEAPGTTKKKKRISDCLVDSDGGEEVPSPPSPRTPRLRIPIFTCARLRFARPGRKGGGGGRKELAAEKSEASSTDSSAGWKAASSGTSSTGAAGMGLSLLFLLAKTCVELKKMAEVRAQMEAFLQEMKDQLMLRTTKDSTTTTTASPCLCHAPAGARTDGRGHGAGAASSSSPDTARPRHFHREKRVGWQRRDVPFYALTGNPLFDLDRDAASSSAMETASETEASSEVEDPAAASFMAVDVAGPQLQLNRDTEQGTPPSSSDGDSFIELQGGFGAGAAGRGGNAVWRRRDSEDGHEEEEEEEEEQERRGGGEEGVSAVELERRLQEVLHRRSRERIEELEAALRRAERKVMEKEMEARLWKDTAKLALQPHDGDTRGGTGQ